MTWQLSEPRGKKNQQGAIRGFKPLLEESQKFSYGPAIDSLDLMEKVHNDAVTVAGEYLRTLKEHANEVLERRLGDAFATMKLRYILTVPAVWSDKPWILRDEQLTSL